jgi:hypothetical protein
MFRGVVEAIRLPAERGAAAMRNFAADFLQKQQNAGAVNLDRGGGDCKFSAELQKIPALREFASRRRRGWSATE